MFQWPIFFFSLAETSVKRSTMYCGTFHYPFSGG